MPLHVSSTVLLIIRWSKLYYTASGIVTTVGGRPVRRLRESSLNLRTGQPPTGVTIPDVAYYTFDLLMMSKLCAKHLQTYIKLIIKQEFLH